MRVILEIKKPKDFEILIPLLKRLKISFFQQKDDSELKQESLVSVPVQKLQKWDFQKFYGSTKAKLTLDEIDQQLNELRKEWDRDIY